MAVKLIDRHPFQEYDSDAPDLAQEDQNIDMFQLGFQGYKLKIPSPLEYRQKDIIEYEKDLTAIDASNNFEIDTKYDHVFVFGVKVNDFRTIKKEKIFALHHSAIQQIHKNAEAEKTKLAEAETEITTLKSTVETQQTTIDNQQNTINTLQSTLAALEARIAALENP